MEELGIKGVNGDGKKNNETPVYFFLLRTYNLHIIIWARWKK